jgi:hypothetical protein
VRNVVAGWLRGVAAAVVAALLSPAGTAAAPPPDTGAAPPPDAGAAPPYTTASFAWPEASIIEALTRVGGPAVAGITHLDPAGTALYRRPERVSPILAAMSGEPLRSPELAWALGTEITGREFSLSRLIRLAAFHGGVATPTGDDLPELDTLWRRSGEEGAFFDAIAAYYDDGRRLSGNDRDELRRLAPRVPHGAARVTAFLLMAHVSADRLLERTFDRARLPKERLDRRNFDRLAMAWIDRLSLNPEQVRTDELERLAPDVDFSAVGRAAAYLGGAIDLATAALDQLQASATDGTFDRDYDFGWMTPRGRVAISGSGTQHHDGPHLLILDLGGDDAYRGAGAAVFPEQSVSMILDRAGNDRYVPADSASAGTGGAIGGVSLVADLSGDDAWRSWQVGLGASVFGAAFLWDRAGNDRYESYRFAQGAAAYGLGVLFDAAGRDSFLVRNIGQGAGGPAGVGWLIDADGDDAYRAAVGPALDPVTESDPTLTDGASGLAQGFGFGTVNPMPAGPGARGGFGLLLDRAGTDDYRAGAQAQGSGAWYGAGLLIDAGGNDDYRALGAAAGSGFEHGFGLLLDAAGDDHHRAGVASLGAGRRFGTGICVDAAGADRYDLSDFGLGDADVAGFALAADLAGDDRYRQELATSGATPNLSPRLLDAVWCTALFFDGGGRDDYDLPGRGAAEGGSWGGGTAPAAAVPHPGAGADTSAAPAGGAAAPDARRLLERRIGVDAP